MRISLPLKLGVGVVLLFAVVIAVLVFYKPLMKRYYISRLFSDNPGASNEAAGILAQDIEKIKPEIRKWLLSDDERHAGAAIRLLGRMKQEEMLSFVPEMEQVLSGRPSKIVDAIIKFLDDNEQFSWIEYFEDSDVSEAVLYGSEKYPGHENVGVTFDEFDEELYQPWSKERRAQLRNLLYYRIRFTENVETREWAAKEVFEISDSVLVNSLNLTVRNHPDAEIRRTAVMALRDILSMGYCDSGLIDRSDVRETKHAGYRSAIKSSPPILLGILKNDPEPRVRAEAASALSVVANTSLLAPLTAALRNDSDARVRRAAAEGLGYLGDNIYDSLPEVKENSSDAPPGPFSKIDRCPEMKNVLDALLWSVENATDKTLRANAALATGVIADNYAFTTLMRRLAAEKEVIVSKKILFSLGWLKNPEAVPELINTLQTNPEEVIRRGAAYALGRIEDSRAITPLIEAYEKETLAPVREEIVEALGEFESEKVVDVLTRALLTDNSSEVRKRAILEIWYMESWKVIIALTKALRSDNNTDVRQLAAKCLGYIEDNTAVEPLLEALNNASELEVREEAAAALGNRRDLRIVPHLLRAFEEGRCVGPEHDLLGYDEAADALRWAFPGFPKLDRDNETVTVKEQADRFRKFYRENKDRLRWDEIKRQYYLKVEKEKKE